MDNSIKIGDLISIDGLNISPNGEMYFNKPQSSKKKAKNKNSKRKQRNRLKVTFISRG